MAPASKLCSMKEAIAESVRDGDSLVIDGFTHLICFAAGHEIIRQQKRGLTAIRLTPDLVYDQLIEASWCSRGPAIRESAACTRSADGVRRARLLEGGCRSRSTRTSACSRA
jgi:hypothetical protein